MSAEHNLSPQDYELLSAYIDGELTDGERTSLEQRLATESFLQRELNALRSTVGLIHQLQPMIAPRNFTLTEAMVNSQKVIQLKPRRRVHPSYLSLVASVVLMLFGVIFMLSDITETQDFSVGVSAPLQSGSTSEKNEQPEIASAPTLLATVVDLQTERTMEEPAILGAITIEEAEAIPAEANATLNQQTPPTDEGVADADTEFRLGFLGDDNVEATSDGALFSVEAPPSAVESLASTAADFEDAGDGLVAEAQLADAVPEAGIIELDAPQPMTGGEGAELEALGVTTTASNENPDSNDDTVDDARNDEFSEVIGRIAPTATKIPPMPSPTLPPSPPPPSSRARDESPPTQTLNNIPIGAGLLVIGLLLLITSLAFIRRNRS